MGKNNPRKPSSPEAKKQAAIWCAIAVIAVAVMMLMANPWKHQPATTVYFVKLRWTCSALNLDTVGVQLEHRRRLVHCLVVCLVYFRRECLFR